MFFKIQYQHMLIFVFKCTACVCRWSYQLNLLLQNRNNNFLHFLQDNFDKTSFIDKTVFLKLTTLFNADYVTVTLVKYLLLTSYEKVHNTLKKLQYMITVPEPARSLAVQQGNAKSCCWQVLIGIAIQVKETRSTL